MDSYPDLGNLEYKMMKKRVASVSELVVGTNSNLMSNLAYPFTDSEIASRHEAWYNTEGRCPNRLEKEGRKCLLGRLPQASSLLELGSGTGYFTRWFEIQGVQEVWLD